jgi:hypothetical protein
MPNIAPANNKLKASANANGSFRLSFMHLLLLKVIDVTQVALYPQCLCLSSPGEKKPAAKGVQVVKEAVAPVFI